MTAKAYPSGQAIFVRTDTPDFEEQVITFSTLEEMVRVCSEPRPNMVLEKVVVSAMPDQEVCGLTFGFLAATKTPSVQVPR